MKGGRKYILGYRRSGRSYEGKCGEIFGDKLISMD